MEVATLTAIQSLAFELAPVPIPAHQEEAQTSATASSTAEAASSQSTPVERWEFLAQSIKKAKTSINTEGSPHQNKGEWYTATAASTWFYNITCWWDYTGGISCGEWTDCSADRSREAGLEFNTRDHKQQDRNWQHVCSCTPQNHTHNITCYSKEESDYKTCRTTHWTGPKILKRVDPWPSWWPSHKITCD